MNAARANLLLFLCVVSAAVVQADEPNPPRITDCTPKAFLGDLVCVCGSFPTAESINGITIDGKPVAPFASSAKIVAFRLPKELTPGTHRISGLPSAGFSASDSVEIIALKFTIKIDQQALLRGETTTMHAYIEGTTEALQIELTNKTPAIIELEGGVQQTATTSGGFVNKFERKVRGLQRGQFDIRYRLIAPTCPCMGQPSDAAPPDAGPSDVPGESVKDEPSTPIGETVTQPPPETPCDVSDVKGAFEPAQGTWQDDPFFRQFDKRKAGNKLKKESERSYRAELPMVRDRLTLLFGTGETDFNEIIIEGRTTGKTPVDVQVLFTLYEGSRKIQSIYRSTETTQILLNGPCGEKKKFEIRIPTQQGLPPKKAFNMFANDSYRIEAELVPAGTEIGTGIKVEVKGEVVQTNLPTLYFVPVILLKPSDPSMLQELKERLKKISDRLADESSEYIDDYFPLRPASVNVDKSDVRDLSGLLEKVDLPDLNKLRDLPDEEIRNRLGEKIFERMEGARKLQLDVLDKAGLLLKKDVTLEMLRDGLTSGRKLAKEGLVIVILSDADFTGFIPDPDPSGPRGVALSEKVIVLRADQGAYMAGVDSVAHEIIHTREYSWDERDMPGECGINYHNVSERTANGHRIENGITEVSERIKSIASIMGSGDPWWINQCSYLHMLINLQKAVDPAVILLRGLVARDGSRSAGALFPAYQMEGEIDLLESRRGDWAIVLRDSAGAELKRYRFEPDWKLPDTITARKIAGFSFRIQAEPNLSRLDLEGPSGLLTTLSVSKTPPRIQILSPQNNEKVSSRNVQIRWEASDDDRDLLLYSVLYSTDNGESWKDLGFEISQTSFDFEIQESAQQHVVKVIATDGFHSAEDTVRFSSK